MIAVVVDANSGTKPNATFTARQARSPVIRKIRGRDLSLNHPFANLASPYTTPCRVRKRPRDVLVTP